MEVETKGLVYKHSISFKLKYSLIESKRIYICEVYSSNEILEKTYYNKDWN